VRAGAFDSINDHRASLMASVGIAMEAAEQENRASSQNSLFGATSATVEGPKLIHAGRWEAKEQLQNEKLALGYYFSGHPFQSYAAEVEAFVRTRLAGIQPQGQSVVVAGVIYSIRQQQTRRGRMAVVVLDDGTARVELTVFNELFESHRNWLKEDQLLIVEGKASFDNFTQGLRLTADRLYDLVAARSRFARKVRLHCNGQSSGSKLKELLAPYRNGGDGGCLVSVVYSNNDAVAEIELGDAWRVKLEDGLINSLGNWIDPKNVQIVYP